MKLRTSHPILSPYYWIGSFAGQKFANRVIGVFGLIWLLIEALAFFLPEVEAHIVAHRPTSFIAVVVFSVACALWHIRPRVMFQYRLKDRDLNVRIHIIDAFRTQGALVVPTNTYFVADVDSRMLHANSIQGALIRKYFDGKPSELQRAIDTSLSCNEYQNTAEIIRCNDGSDFKKFPIGSVVSLKKDGRVFYLLANTQLSEAGRASSTEEELLCSLRSLWNYLMERAIFGEIVVPLVGSQHGRMVLTREQIVQHILRTFVESCRVGTPCRNLTIAVYPPDVKQFDIDLNFLDELLRFETRLAFYSSEAS